MSRDFNGSSHYLRVSSTAAIVGLPCTLACWCQEDGLAIGGDEILISLTSSTTGSGSSRIISIGTQGDGLIRYAQALVVDNSSTLAQPLGTVDITGGAWHHICGTLDNEDFNIFTDGGDQQNDGTSIGTLTLNRTSIAAWRGSSTGLYFDGRIAEVGIWNVVLDRFEVAALKYYPPYCIRPESLVAYLPLMGRTSPEPDLYGDNPGVLVSTPAYAEHRTLIYPRKQIFNVGRNEEIIRLVTSDRTKAFDATLNKNTLQYTSLELVDYPVVHQGGR